MSIRQRFVLAVVLAALVSLPAFAQGTSSVISGNVTDPTGALVPGASIVVRNLDTGLDRQVTSDARGRYRVVGLPPGRYEVHAELKGFGPEVRTGLTLTVAQELVVSIDLKVSAVTEEMIIAGEASAVETTGSTLNALVDEKKIRDLPLNGRDMAQLILLQPGVINSRGSVQSANTGRGTRFSVNGSRPNQNLFTLDGTNINDALNNTPGSAQGLLVGVETVREFRVLTNTFSAEYGRAAGGVFVAVTKSGTNDLHGSLFEFLRNDKVDARNFFDPALPPFRRNQFGGTIGGPIVKNKTFFFGSYEGLRERKGITSVAVVPDDDARLGRIPGQPAVTVDSRTLPLLDLYPHANGERLGDGTAKFIGNTNRVSDGDFWTAKIDHKFSNSDSLFVRYLYDDSNQVIPRAYPEFPNRSVNRKQTATIQESKIISASLVNEARVGFNRATPAEVLAPSTRNLSIIAGQPLGDVDVAGLDDVGTDRSNPKSFFLNNYQFSDTLFILKGRHNVKLGASFDRYQVNGVSESRSRGQLRFRSLADLLAFRIREIQASPADADFRRGYRQSLAGVFFQDDFKVRTRLTVNVGVRYDYISSPSEANGKLANFHSLLDPTVTVGAPYFQPSERNIAPRVGFAYDVTGNGKTAIRGGFGLFHDPPLFNLYRSPSFRNPPFVNGGILPGCSASQGPPCASTIPITSAQIKGSDPSAESIQYRLRPMYAMQYNLNIQKDIQGTVLSVAYVGSRGVNLMGMGDANTAYPQILSGGQAFFADGLKRRNPNFSTIRSVFQGFNSFYNSMNASVQRRFSRGLQFQLSYTFGRSIDEVGGVGGRNEYENGQARTFDPYNRRLDRALSNFDVRHNFVANATYELPFGNSLHGVSGVLLKGWQANTIVTVSSGVPYTVYVDGDPDRDATSDNAARPNLVPGVSLTPASGSTPDRWFNAAAFVAPVVGFRGTAGRNILRGPNLRTVDFALFKEFAVTEKGRLQFRAEGFNLFNRPNFDLPSNASDGEQVFTYTPASSSKAAVFAPLGSVGRIFSTISDAREIQFALKFIF